MADALSRKEEVAALSVTIPTWIKEVIDSCENGDFSQKCISYCLMGTSTAGEMSYQNGILKIKGKLYVGVGNDIRKKLIEELHSSQQGKHFGMQACYQRAKQLLA